MPITTRPPGVTVKPASENPDQLTSQNPRVKLRSQSVSLYCHVSPERALAVTFLKALMVCA